MAAPEPAKRWWQRLLARTPPATVATDDEWFCRLVEPHVVAALAQDEAAVTVDGPAPARTTYTVQALDAVGGGVTVEVVVRNPNVPWFAFAERVAAEVAATAAETVAGPGVASGDTAGARRSSRASSAAAAAVSQPKAEGGSEQADVQAGAAASEAALPRPVCLYAVDATGRPRPWSLTGTLLTHPVPEPATTLRWAYVDAGREAGSAMTTVHHQQGGVLLFLFSLLVALLYIAHHVPVVAHALAAIYSHRHLFATGATHVVQGVTYVYHHVSPFAGKVVHGAETGAKDVVRVGKAVTQTVAPVVDKAVAATTSAAHKAAPVVQTGAHAIGHAAKTVAHEAEVVGKAVAKEAEVVAKAVAKGATTATHAVDKEAKAVVATVKAHTKGVGGASASAKKAAARKALRGATLVPLTVLPDDDTADAATAPATTRYFGLLVKRRSHWTCAAVLAMPATAFAGYPPDFYLGQHLLRLTKLVNTVMAGSYAAFCTEAVASLPPAERGPVLREMGRAGKRIRAVVRKHKLPTPLPPLASPQQLLYEACCHPASKKQSADCKGYKALYHDTLKRSGWLTRKGELRCEAVRPRRTRRRVG